MEKNRRIVSETGEFMPGYVYPADDYFSFLGVLC